MLRARLAMYAGCWVRASLALLAACASNSCGPSGGAAGPSAPAKSAPEPSESASSAAAASSTVGSKSAPPTADEVASLRARVQALEEELLRTRADLKSEAERRLRREEEWLEYTRGIALLESLAAGVPKFEVDPDVARSRGGDASAANAEPRQAAAGAAHEPARDVDEGEPDGGGSGAASASIASDTATQPPPAPEAGGTPSLTSEMALARLRALLAAEAVRGVDVLEVGLVQSDHLGPVVLRVRDEAGRVLSVLAADRLRLECSRAGRSVTLVLEHGYERKAGAKTSFEGGPADEDGRGGVRRVVVADCDPRPWLEGLPSLFRLEALQPAPHDGSISVESLRAALNIKLREDLSAGHWRVEGLGGVQRGVLFEVSLAQLDEKGNRVRTLVADRATIAPLSADAARGVEVLLQDGSQVKVDSTTPFLDARFRLVLPRADPAEWRAARIPLVEVPGAGAKSEAPVDQPR
jgi:hypothetical protein